MKLKSVDEIKDIARTTLKHEAEAVAGLVSHINNDFVEVVRMILNSSGRVIMTGIGKSANIAQKIVATLNSTGTPAIFMHAADALHGDLGTIRRDDIVICLSKSGNTPEIKVLIPILKLLVNKLVVMVGNTESYLAKQADYIINVSVKKEACPNNRAHIKSTAHRWVMHSHASWNAEASIQDFARFHPGGLLENNLSACSGYMY